MSEQTKMEIIKALAYGEDPAQVALAEDVNVSVIQKIQQECAADIAEEREDLKKAGYLE